MILGALLAAGTGARFKGGNKLLTTLDGEPVVSHAASTLRRSRLDAVVAIVGHERERVADALPAGIEALRNPDYERGQSASVRRAVEFTRERGDVDALLFALGDMPNVSVETVDALLDAYREHEEGIVAPRYDGERGNPVLFGSQYFDALASVEGDRGGRDLLDSEPVARVDVADPGVRQDVDTRVDLRELQESTSNSSRG